MNLKALTDQCGVVRVRTAPLLMLIGAAIAGDNGPDIETVIEMLDPEADDDPA